MASVKSTGWNVSGRLRSGDLLYAGLAVALLLGEFLSLPLAALSLLTPALCLYITLYFYALLSPQLFDWLNPFIFSVHAFLCTQHSFAFLLPYQHLLLYLV